MLYHLWAVTSRNGIRPTSATSKKKATRNRAQPVEDGQLHIRVEVLKHLDAITVAMLKKAKAGGTAPLRLLWELGKLHQDATARTEPEPSLSSMLIRELRDKKVLATPSDPRK